MLRYIIFVISILFISCDFRFFSSDNEIEYSKEAIVKTKDVSEYIKLTAHYENADSYMDILPYDLIMTSDNYCTGCFSFYENYLRIHNHGKFDRLIIKNLDKSEQNFLLYLLNKGAIKENEYCRKALYFYYKNGIVVDKNLKKADSLSRFYPKNYFKD